MAVAQQIAGVGRVEIHQPLSAHGRRARSHAVRGVARGARESVVDVARVLAEAGVGHDLIQVVAFLAQRVWSGGAQVGFRKKIHHGCDRRDRLADL